MLTVEAVSALSDAPLQVLHALIILETYLTQANHVNDKALQLAQSSVLKSFIDCIGETRMALDFRLCETIDVMVSGSGNIERKRADVAEERAHRLAALSQQLDLKPRLLVAQGGFHLIECASLTTMFPSLSLHHN